MTTTAPNPVQRSRWLDWKPKARILADSAQSEPTKPSKPGSKLGSVGFVGATPGNSLKIKRVLCSSQGEPASFLTCAAWKAAALNRLFEEQGATGKPGRITAATVGHGERWSWGLAWRSVVATDCAAIHPHLIPTVAAPAASHVQRRRPGLFSHGLLAVILLNRIFR